MLLLFIKKSKWIFVLISFIAFFYICYSFYCMNGFIEGATTTTQPCSKTAPDDSKKNSSYFQSLSNPKKNSNAAKFTAGQKEIAGVYNSCSNLCDNKTNPKMRQCILNKYKNKPLASSSKLTGDLKLRFVDKQQNCKDDSCLAQLTTLKFALNDPYKLIK